MSIICNYTKDNVSLALTHRRGQSTDLQAAQRLGAVCPLRHCSRDAVGLDIVVSMLNRELEVLSLASLRPDASKVRDPMTPIVRL